MMKGILGFFLFSMLMALPMTGQKTLLTAKEIDEKFSQVWKTSQKLRKDYSWKERTEVIRDGEVVNILVEELWYGADGKLKKKVLKDEQAALPTTPVIRQIAESAKEKIVRFLRNLAVFLNKYALEDDKLRNQYFLKARIGSPDKNGQILVTGVNVLVKGDKLQWWIDTRSYSITRATVSTIYEDTEIDFSGSYGYFPAGMNYMTAAEIKVPGKDIVVKLRFYDFVK